MYGQWTVEHSTHVVFLCIPSQRLLQYNTQPLQY